jgi:hypothetical protein
MTQPLQTPSVIPSVTSAAPLLEHAGRLLTETRTVKLSLVEDTEKTGKVFVRGEFGRADLATENKRVYPKKLWEREFTRLEQSLNARQMFGELDHPTDGRTSLNRVSHIITNLTLDDNNIVVGEAEILDTERGKNLMAMLKAGCSVGVSSRGYGSTKPNDKGEEVVQEDYRLVTYDFVAEPADSNALPKVFFEENQHMAGPELDAKLSEEKAKLKEEFAKELVLALGKVKVEAREQAKAELLADPDIAGAKSALDQILSLVKPFVTVESAEALVKAKDAEIAKLQSVIAERDAQIAELEQDGAKLAETAREVGYKFFLEQQVSNDADAALIRKLVGDVKGYGKAEDIKTKIEAIRAELDSKRQEQAALAAEIRAQVEKAAAVEQQATQRAKVEAQRAQVEAKKAQAETELLKEALEKAVEGQKDMALRLYVEKRLANHPKAGKVRSLIESSHPTSKADVDGILNSYSHEPARDTDTLEQVRARVRKVTRGGTGSTALDEEAPAASVVGKQGVDFAGLGVSIGDLQRLSGIDRK